MQTEETTKENQFYVTELKQYLFSEFPTAFESNFAREMLENILEFSQSFDDLNIQFAFVQKMIPEIHVNELLQFVHE